MESSEKAAPIGEATSNTKERSTIAFPYSDLESAIEVAKGIHNAGGTACDMDQLAAQLSMEAKGGGFRMRVNGAQTFGLCQYERGGRVVLSDLGMQIIDSATERTARMSAFLAVELYARVFEEFKGGPLPPQAGLERTIVKFGVSAKVADRARQALMRSAKQAGFFDQASDRLVKPSIKAFSEPKEQPTANKTIDANNGGNSGGGGGGDDHPLIRGLLVTLPKPAEKWAAKDRVNWLVMASSIFNAIYKPGDAPEGEITIKLEGAKPQQS